MIPDSKTSPKMTAASLERLSVLHVPEEACRARFAFVPVHVAAVVCTAKLPASTGRTADAEWAAADDDDWDVVGPGGSGVAAKEELLSHWGSSASMHTDWAEQADVDHEDHTRDRLDAHASCDTAAQSEPSFG